MPESGVKKTVQHLNPQPEPPSENKLKSKKTNTGPKRDVIKPG
jgi:hypothetical protein